MKREQFGEREKPQFRDNYTRPGKKKDAVWDRNRLIALLDTSPAGITIVEKSDGKVSFSNEQAYKLFGENLFHTTMNEFPVKFGLFKADHTPYKPWELPGSRSLLHGEVVNGEEMFVRRENGQEFYISVNTSPLFDARGEVEAVISVFNDITEKKQAEKQAHYHAYLINHVSDAIFVIDKEYTITFWNEAAERVYGWKAEEVIGKNQRQLMQTRFTGISEEEVLGVLDREGEAEADLIQNHKDGRDIYLHSRFRAIKTHDNELKELVIVNRDVTDRKKAEEALRDSENLFSKIFHHNPGAILITDLCDGKIIEVNQSFLDIFGWERNEAEGKSTLELGVYADPEDRRRMIGSMDSEGRITNFELRSRNKKGEEIFISASSEKVVTGNKHMLLTVLLDITDRKKAEQELKYSEEAYSNIFKNSPVAIVLAGLPDYRIAKANDAFLQLFGYSEEELTGNRSVDLQISTPEDMDKILEIYYSQGYVRDYEMPLRTKDGTQLALLISLDPVLIRGKQYIMANIVDLTERRKIEQTILKKERENAQLAKIIGLSSTAVAFSTTDGEIIYANKAMEEITGYSVDELKGLNWNAQLTAPEFREMEKGIREMLLENGFPAHYEKEYILKNGSRVPVEIFLNLMRDDEGNPEFWFAFITDITARKRNEEHLHRLIRTLKAMQKSSQLIAHVKNEREFLDKVCQIIVEDCEQKMAWVGYKINDAAKTIFPVAMAGEGASYVNSLQLTWDDQPLGRGPVGTTIREGEPVVINDIRSEPNFEPWRQEAEKNGFSSVIALPLFVNDEVTGALTIYSADVDSFIMEEKQMLLKLANDLSFGITAIRLNRALRKAKDDLEGKVEQRTFQLRKTMHELETERLHLNEVLNMIPAYVLVITKDHSIRFSNSIFRTEFGQSTTNEFFEVRERNCGDCTVESIFEQKAMHHWEWKAPNGKNYEVSDLPFVDSDGTPLIIEMGIDVTEKKNFDKLLIKKILETEEKDRRVFANDLHDDLGPTLSAIKLQLSFLKSDIQDEGQREMLNICDALLSEGIEKMKLVANSIMPTLMEKFGLESSVVSFVTRVTKTSKIKAEISTDLGSHRFDPETELHLYRIVSELVTNTIKHSGATRLHLDMHILDKTFVLIYSDNGRGYDFKSNLIHPAGIGLQSIKNRARLIEADFHFREERGKTVFELRKPV